MVKLSRYIHQLLRYNILYHQNLIPGCHSNVLPPIRLRTLGTHYHSTLDPAVLWTPSNDTSRPICSDSLNLTPSAPLYLWTLWHYTNVVFIIIITSLTHPPRVFTNLRMSALQKCMAETDTPNGTGHALWPKEQYSVINQTQ